MMMPIIAEIYVSNPLWEKQKNLRGRLCMGTAAARIVSAPFVRPDAPKPATALPTINILDD
jgi:hypothetical protein